jgi:hypothetical protein
MPRIIPVFVGTWGAIRLAVRKMFITALVAAAGTTALVEARDCFSVVIVDVWTRLEDDTDRVFVALEVRNEDFDRAVGQALLYLADSLGEDVGAEVRQVIAVDGR